MAKKDNLAKSPVTRESDGGKDAEGLPEIMTLKEVADYFRVSVATISRKAALGEIPGKRIGTSWRFARKKMVDLI